MEMKIFYSGTLRNDVVVVVIILLSSSQTFKLLCQILSPTPVPMVPNIILGAVRFLILRCMGKLSGEATLFSLSPSLSLGGQLLKKRICSFWSKFFPLRVDPTFKGLHWPESKQEITRVVPLGKMIENLVGVLIYF